MNFKAWGPPFFAAVTAGAVGLVSGAIWLGKNRGIGEQLADIQAVLSAQNETIGSFERRLVRLEKGPVGPGASVESGGPTGGEQEPQSLTFQQELELMEKLQSSMTPAEREKAVREMLASERRGAQLAALRALIADDPERGIAETRAFVSKLDPNAPSGSWGLAEQAILALADARSAAAETVLYGYFDSGERMVRIPAARALDQRGDPRALDRLIREFSEGLSSSDPTTRKRSVTDLGRTKSARALEALSPLLADPNVEVRLEIARVLYQVRSPESLQLSRRLMDDPSPAVRDEARKAHEMLEDFLK